MDTFPQKFSLPFFLLSISLTFHAISAANNDTISIGGNITDGETLVSSGGTFEVSFFTPGLSGNRHMGISYRIGKIQAFVWIANRAIPLTNTLGVLQFIEPGMFVLVNSTGGIVWNSTAPSRPLRNPVAQILDSGNLVVRDADDNRPENFGWQSFDYPTDTYLEGMKLGLNLVTGQETYLSSWKSDDDPSIGSYSLHLDPTGYPQIVVKTGDDSVRYRTVVSTGVRPSGPKDSTSMVSLEMNANEVKYSEDTVNGSGLWRSRLSQGGILQRFAWSDVLQDWFLYRDSSFPVEGDECDSYNFCGANSVCRIDGCECLDKYASRDLDSKGCMRRTALECRSTNVFLEYSGVKLPDSKNSWFSDSVGRCRDECLSNCSCRVYTELDADSKYSWFSDSVGRCRDECLSNCTCTAYTELDAGCLFYSRELMDMRNNVSSDQGGRNLYIRMDESGHVTDESKGNKRVLIASLASGGGVLLLLGFATLILYFRKRKNVSDMRNEVPYNASQEKDSELPLFNLSTIWKATNNFSIENRLGEGEFGAVYTGMLDDGEEIAVKRLSKTSTQGVDELKNEVILIAKLQHRNLVRLLGCCVEGEENMLIYEYLPNKSLDLILFDETKITLLDWGKRFNIINGIAKGLLYLHQDSRLRIIHRDLKASNVLLDGDMNPRISDFGLARSFRGNEIEVQTHKVVGTLGYMPPEYAGEGMFSAKSDIYSFGVLVLEIISGKRNRGSFLYANSFFNLVGYAWKLEQEGESVAIVDAALGDEFESSEALRSIRVALLCIQKYPEDRPNMSSVVFMLGNEIAVAQAKEPGFYTERDIFVGNSSTSTKPTSSSQNEITITCSHGT